MSSDRDTSALHGDSGQELRELPGRLEDLVVRWQAGDRSAGNLLFTTYYHELAAYAHRLFPGPLRRRLDTCDIVQDAFMAAWRSRTKFEYRDTSSFAGWLFTIVENKLWKRWHAERAAMRDAARDRRLEEGLAVDGKGRTPSQDLSLKEEMDRLEAALGHLSPPHRRVVAARYLEGKSWDQISEELGKSKEAAQMLLFRALRKLQEHLGEERLVP